MTDLSTYIQYKQDEQHLLNWITRSTAQITRKFSLESSGLISADGGITLSTLLSCSELIAKYLNTIPSTIVRIFASVIKARKETREVFVRLAENNPTPKLFRRNSTHKKWIEGPSHNTHWTDLVNHENAKSAYQCTGQSSYGVPWVCM